MTENDYKKWETTRQRKWRYVLTHGVLIWVLVGVAYYIIRLDFDTAGFTWLGFAGRVLVAALAGVVTGYLSYRRRERMYQRHRKNSS